MKTSLKLFGFAVLFVGVSSCSELNELGITLDALERSATFTVGVSTVADSTYITLTDSFSMDDFKNDVENAGFTYDKDKLEKLKIKKIKIEVLEPESSNFNWAKSMETNIISKNHPKKSVGSILDFPTNVSSSVFNVNGDDIAMELKDEWFYFEIITASDEIIPIPHKIKATFTYSMLVK